jgi:hypothetical protein
MTFLIGLSCRSRKKQKEEKLFYLGLEGKLRAGSLFHKKSRINIRVDMSMITRKLI